MILNSEKNKPKQEEKKKYLDIFLFFFLIEGVQ